MLLTLVARSVNALIAFASADVKESSTIVSTDSVGLPPVRVYDEPDDDLSLCRIISAGISRLALTVSEKVNVIVFESKSKLKSFRNGRTRSSSKSKAGRASCFKFGLRWMSSILFSEMLMYVLSILVPNSGLALIMFKSSSVMKTVIIEELSLCTVPFVRVKLVPLGSEKIVIPVNRMLLSTASFHVREIVPKFRSRIKLSNTGGSRSTVWSVTPNVMLGCTASSSLFAIS